MLIYESMQNLHKFLGIDYGSKRVGLATADSETRIAFPKAVFQNGKKLLSDIEAMCKEEKIEKVILGQSKDLAGRDNEIALEIGEFKEKLEKKLKLTVVYEPEFYSSLQASRLQGENAMIDASAAAIILQSYLDKFKIKNK